MSALSTHLLHDPGQVRLDSDNVQLLGVMQYMRVLSLPTARQAAAPKRVAAAAVIDLSFGAQCGLDKRALLWSSGQGGEYRPMLVCTQVLYIRMH